MTIFTFHLAELRPTTTFCVPTFHPAFLLRNPGEEYKRMAWEDLQLARREYDRRRTR